MSKELQLGLKANWQQFSVLVLINAFVGGMVGMERSIFPQFAEEEFHIESHTAILSFIVAFGVAKAVTNYFAGLWANKVGRKNLLIIGWLFAIPVPFMLMNAGLWFTVVMSNILLGISQGLAWSSTVVMKIDLVGEKDRGLAMGFNEFAGYLAVGIVALATGLIADQYGVTPYPFYVGIGISIVGLSLSILFVKDTRQHVQHESNTTATITQDNIFLETTFKNRSLSSITQAGIVNNLNDGMIWGLLPLLLSDAAFNTKTIGWMAAIYPTVWGFGQLFTGKLADIFPKKPLLFGGMLVQGIAIVLLPFFLDTYSIVAISITIGLGTALVYPTFLAAIADAISPQQRAESIGVFRLWRDLGYAFGAILSGIIGDLFGTETAIVAIGVLTIFSSGIIHIRMPFKPAIQ
jgi:predicted MFS family arabinose efflux permease